MIYHINYFICNGNYPASKAFLPRFKIVYFLTHEETKQKKNTEKKLQQKKSHYFFA